MIVFELERVVVHEPTAAMPTSYHSERANELRQGMRDGITRLVWIPTLALIVIVWFAKPASIVPLERVWHMDLRSGSDPLAELEAVIP